jgi:hypothetical protein
LPQAGRRGRWACSTSGSSASGSDLGPEIPDVTVRIRTRDGGPARRRRPARRSRNAWSWPT